MTKKNAIENNKSYYYRFKKPTAKWLINHRTIINNIVFILGLTLPMYLMYNDIKQDLEYNNNVNDEILYRINNVK